MNTTPPVLIEQLLDVRLKIRHHGIRLTRNSLRYKQCKRAGPDLELAPEVTVVPLLLVCSPPSTSAIECLPQNSLSKSAPVPSYLLNLAVEVR